MNAFVHAHMIAVCPDEREAEKSVSAAHSALGSSANEISQ